ncbi:hypothetical protein ACFLZ5_06285 [Thermodesulfobacteriota bacterium]
MKKNSMINLTKGLLYTILALFLAGTIINCGGGSTAGPAQVQVPKTLIQDYISKHETMVDLSLVDFYAKDERPKIAAAVNKKIDEMKSAGELDKLLKATFDFSNTKISVVGQKEDYINDRPTKLIMVSVSGSYTMQQADSSKTIPADETVVLEQVNNSWMVTERIHPWS